MAQEIIGAKTFGERDPKVNSNFTELYGKVNAGDSGLREFLDPISEGDDKGIILTGGQFAVGSTSEPSESVFGEGDSYGVGLEDVTSSVPNLGSAWHFDYANLSALTITGAIDVTEILSSDSGSTTPLFGGVTVGNALLIGSNYPYGGAKAKIDTLGFVEPENITAEYLKDNSPSWITTPYMVTDADFPYTQKGWNIATCSSCSEQWRFGFDSDNLPTVWDKVTLNINGTDYTKYWSIFRITTAITTDPTLEQIKLHTNRFEINSDGVTEYFGRARYPKTLIAGMQNTIQNSAASPLNESADYAVGISAGFTDNEFVNGTNDGFMLIQNIEEGLDTSIPLILDVSWYVKGTATGDVNVGIDLVKVSDGFVYDGSAIPESISNTETITVDSNEVRKTSRIKFLVNSLDTSSTIVIHLHRDARSTNPLDTLNGNIIITNVRLTGYFWRP